jgi:uncharacterized protein with von Willebrand factor type A (vWA) domain
MSRFQLPFQERIALRERLARKVHSTVVHDPTSDYHLDAMMERSEKFEAVVQDTPEISELGDGSAQYEHMPELTKDVFHAHYQAGKEVKVREPAEVMPTSELHSEIMRHYVVQDDFEKARARTQDDDLMAAVATMAAQRRMVEAVADAVAQQPEQQQAQQDAQQAQERIDEIRAGIAAAGGASKDTKAELREQIQSRNAALDALAAAPAPTGAAQIAASMATEAKEAADDLGSMPGMGSFEVDRPSPEDALAMVDQLREQPNLRLMLELMGRLERDFRFARARRVIEGRGEVVGVTIGDDPELILPDEYGLLVDETTRLEFFRRYLDRSLLQFEMRGEERAGKGPLVVLRDSSGSMSKQVGGMSRFEWATAFSLALMRVANKEKRDTVLIDFTTATRVRATVKATQRFGPAQVLALATQVINGGTSCDTALDKGLGAVQGEAGFDIADIVLITDGIDHWSPSSTQAAADCRAYGVRVHGVGITTGSEPEYLTQMAELTDGTACSVTDFDGGEQVRHIATAMS